MSSLWTFRGRDRPGVTRALLEVLSGVVMLDDISQVEIHGLLILSFLVTNPAQTLVDAIHDKATELNLVFETREAPVVDGPPRTFATLTLLTPHPTLSVPLVHQIAAYLHTERFNIESVVDGLADFGGATLTLEISSENNTSEKFFSCVLALTNIAAKHESLASLRPRSTPGVPMGKTLLIFDNEALASDEDLTRVLRFLGFRLAVFLDTDVPRAPNFDYAIFPGGDERKEDFARLFAAREAAVNVIYISTSEVPAAVAELLVMPNSVARPKYALLYLLGFKPDYVAELGRRVVGMSRSSSHAVLPVCDVPDGVWVLLKVMGRDRGGLLAGVLEILLKVLFGERAYRLEEVLQRNVHGILCLAVRATVEVRFEAEFVARMKEGIEGLGELQVDVVVKESKMPYNLSQQSLNKGRAIVTVNKGGGLEIADLNEILGMLTETNIVSFRKLSPASEVLSALELVVEGERDKVRARLLASSTDISVQSDSAVRVARRVIVFDMDSTLIQQEVIDELGKLAGVAEEVSAITERAMRGELDFAASLSARVELLKGWRASELFARAKEKIELTPGALQVCVHLKKLGFKMAVISGGFLPVARYVQELLGLDYAFANELEETSEGLLTGRTKGSVVTPLRKQALLEMIAAVEGCSAEQVIAVGDGANDIPMLQTAGLGVAFCAKPKVQKAAEHRINVPHLGGILYLLGLSYQI